MTRLLMTLYIFIIDNYNSERDMYTPYILVLKKICQKILIGQLLHGTH